LGLVWEDGWVDGWEGWEGCLSSGLSEVRMGKGLDLWVALAFE
jgi:hypothetical protein